MNNLVLIKVYDSEYLDMGIDTFIVKENKKMLKKLEKLQDLDLEEIEEKYNYDEGKHNFICKFIMENFEIIKAEEIEIDSY